MDHIDECIYRGTLLKFINKKKQRNITELVNDLNLIVALRYLYKQQKGA